MNNKIKIKMLKIVRAIVIGFKCLTISLFDIFSKENLMLILSYLCLIMTTHLGGFKIAIGAIIGTILYLMLKHGIILYREIVK